MKIRTFTPHAVMKTMFVRLSRLALVLPLALCQWPLPVHGVLPEPDNIIFGTLVLDGRPITAADFDVVVEVRRTPTGRPISSYQMGSQGRLGDFYSVRIPLESVAPRIRANSTLSGDVVYLVISDINGERESRPITVGGRGALVRLDVGTAVLDSENDGLPDAWELASFGTLTNGANTMNSNGRNAFENFVSGVNPGDSTGDVRLTITRNGSNHVIAFFARQASGPGYDGLNRYYSLEQTTNFSNGVWAPVPNGTNLLGNNTTITCVAPESGLATFYRCQIRLQRP